MSGIQADSARQLPQTGAVDMPKMLGHYIHPMLIVFPLGLFVTAIIFDVIHIVTGTPLWSTIAFWIIAAGIVGGVLAAVFGFLDWRELSSGSRAHRLGMLHGIGNVIVVALFATSWLLRRGDPGQPPTTAMVLTFVAGALGLMTAWLGGELVERLGIGVDEGAHPNAPSSLKTRNARP
jgi:uncharacterized membrane protein